jgi:hypothetical protein
MPFLSTDNRRRCRTKSLRLQGWSLAAAVYYYRSTPPNGREVVKRSEAAKLHAQYCLNEGLPAVAKMEFAKVLREVTQCKVEKKQKRIDGKQVWHYTGFALSC